jgi:hypothetical protein
MSDNLKANTIQTKQEASGTVSVGRSMFTKNDDDGGMVVRNPAPDASPSRAPSESKVFTLSC